MQMVIRLLENKVIQYVKVIGIAIIPIALWFVPIDKDQTARTLCIFKNLTGRNCYGCGITRATVSAIHLNFEQAFAFNKLIVFVFPLLLYLWIDQLIKEGKKANNINN